MRSAQITIITPCLNRVNFIRDAIESVLAQNYPNIEHIIVDGGSTDGTLDLLADYPHLQIMTGPDKSMYDAINKGLQQAHGEIIGLLNSDDFYENNVFKLVMIIFNSNPDTDVVIGKAIVLNETKQGSKQGSLETFYPPISDQNITQTIIQGIPTINAWFFRKKIFEKIGLFDLSFPIAADRDFLIRLSLKEIKISFLEKIVYHYRQHAQSLTITSNHESQTKVLLDNLRLAERYLKQGALNANHKELLREWHSKTAIELFLRYTRQIQFTKVIATVKSGIKYNRHWFWLLNMQIWLRGKEKLKQWFPSSA